VLPLKGFCYRWARWDEFTESIIEIGIEARKGSKGL
jgi:hypothetical protein